VSSFNKLDFPEFVKVPYNDVEALRVAVDDETACVLLEASPAQLGFPEPDAGYFQAVREICDDKGAVFGDLTTGFELHRIEESLDLVK